MKAQYDFARGNRGAVLKTPSGKTRITIRLDGGGVRQRQARAA